MLETIAGLFLATAVSGVLPLVNAELLVITAAAAAPIALLPVVVIVSVAGQMITKAWLFALARSAPERLPGKARTALERAAAVLEERKGTATSVVFASAAVGLPPFYGVSLASGVLGMRLRSFVLSGSAGRIVRFGVLAWLGHRLGARATEALADSAPLAVVLGG